MASTPHQSEVLERWIESFRRRHGRAPRILHVGNIANNAYNNAKVLNEAGCDCDVICYDYYHIMGCPEWEDADFTGTIEDHFRPNWSAIDLRGFRRPRWFVQGPQRPAIRCLLARRHGQTVLARLWWWALAVRRWSTANPSARRTKRGIRRAAAVATGSATTVAGAFRRFWKRTIAGLRALRTMAARATSVPARIVRRTWIAGSTPPALWIIQLGGSILCSWAILVAIPFRSPGYEIVAVPLIVLGIYLITAGEPLAGAVRRIAGAVPHIAGTARPIAGLTSRLRPRRPGPAVPPPSPGAFEQRVARLIVDYRRRFPDRRDPLTPEDAAPYQSVIGEWQQLFACYDLIEAYSTDPILPMLAGSAPYIAYEHGTIRDIPNEPTARGRLTALAYARAEAVVITNPDCLVAARRLGVRRRQAIPHLIDRKYYDEALASGRPLPHDLRAPYVFSPARHDWEVKGTHILIDAFARLAAEVPALTLVMASWGADLPRTMARVETLNVADRIRLVPPLHIHDLIRVARGAAVVVDQFRLGVFGGIGPTALAVGTPLVTHLDHAKSAWCMDEAPVFDAHDAESCYRAMRSALDAKTPAYAQRLQRWMRENYWYGDVVDRHAELYAQALGTPSTEPCAVAPAMTRVTIG